MSTEEKPLQDEKVPETPPTNDIPATPIEEKPVAEEVKKEEPPQTTLLLEEPKESPFKMLIFFSFVCIFGYFIIRMDNIYYKISFIISFMVLTYLFKKYFNPFPKKIKEDDGINLIEG
jgi:hypothetical protein